MTSLSLEGATCATGVMVAARCGLAAPAAPAAPTWELFTTLSVASASRPLAHADVTLI